MAIIAGARAALESLKTGMAAEERARWQYILVEESS